jgi:hypothetical protein
MLVGFPGTSSIFCIWRRALLQSRPLRALRESSSALPLLLSRRASHRQISLHVVGLDQSGDRAAAQLVTRPGGASPLAPHLLLETQVAAMACQQSIKTLDSPYLTTETMYVFRCNCLWPPMR